MLQCHYCGGRLEPRRVEYMSRRGSDGQWVLVKDVPADVCIQCGEQFFAPDVADALSRAVRDREIPGAETLPVTVRRFPATAVR